MEEKRPVKTTWERLFVVYLVGVSVLLAAFIGVFVWAIVSFSEPEKVMPWIIGIPTAIIFIYMFAMLGVLSVYNKKMFDAYLHWKEDEIYTKVKLYVVTPSGERKLSKPCTFSAVGVTCENKVFRWDDFDGRVGYRGEGTDGKRFWYILLYAKNGGVKLFSPQSVKNYCLFKRFCSVPIDGMGEVDRLYEKLFKTKITESALPQEEKSFPTEKTETVSVEESLQEPIERAVKEETVSAKTEQSFVPAVEFVSQRWLWIALFLIVDMAVFIGIGVLLVLKGSAASAGGIGGLGGLVAVLGYNYISRNFPKGTTTVDGQWVRNTTAAGEIKLAVEQTDVVVGGLFIEFLSSVDKVKIFNTKRARECVKMLPFRNFSQKQ